ncbi:MAG: zf-HC2 domain-containing protein [Planctomycetaceae bacterium]|nr:zf-HC2 domain-containing protein [Planctomycetaceae bacterium]
MNDLLHPCESWAERISLAAAGCLSPDEQREVHRHVETCSRCREQLRQQTELCRTLAEASFAADRTETAAVERIMSAVTAEISQPTIVRTRAKKTHSTLLSRSLNTWRWIMRSPVFRIATAVVFVLAITGVAVWFHGGGTALAFADFVRPILQVKTVKYRQTIEVKAPSARTITSQWMILDASRSRSAIIRPDGTIQSVHITDWSKGLSLSLVPETKHATILEYPDKNGRNDPSMWLRLLQMARDHKTKNFHFESLGNKQMDGRRVVGFRICHPGGTPFDLWGDAQTGLPVRVEMTTGMNDHMKTTFSNFVFNTPMDESLFSVEPPAGYTVDRQKVDTAPRKEKDLIEMFRQYAKLTDGTLPDSLDSHTVTWTFWKNYHIRATWDNGSTSQTGSVGDEQKRRLEEQIGIIMDKMDAAMMAGKTHPEQIREFAAQMTKIATEMACPGVIRTTWESFVPVMFKATEQQRQQFEKHMRKMMQGGDRQEQAGKKGNDIGTLINRMVWENLAPATLKANEEKWHEFNELMGKMGGKPNERQKVKERFREAFGDPLLKDVEAWQAEVARVGRARDARIQKNTQEREIESQKFMEAQRQINRGLAFANGLQPAVDAHYAGQGVKLGAADTPIFWYRPKNGKKYRVLYADLSVREADAAPKAPNAQPIVSASGPAK